MKIQHLVQVGRCVFWLWELLLVSLFIGIFVFRDGRGEEIPGSDTGAPQLVIYQGEGGGWRNSAVFSPDSRFILTANSDHSARLYDVATGRELRRFRGHTEGLESAVFAPDGQSIVTASVDQTARLWDVATGLELRQFVGHEGQVSSAVFSPDGQFILTTSYDGTVRLWDVATGLELRRFPTKGSHSAVFAPDGQSFVTAYHDQSARLYEVATGREIRRFVGHEHGVTSAVFSPDGQLVLTTSHDNTMRFWDVATGRELRRFEGYMAQVRSAVFAPDGRSIATANHDYSVCLYDVATGREIRRFQGHTGMVTSVIFSPDGQTIVTMSDDHTVRLWDMATGMGREPLWLEVHTKRSTSAVFSPDGLSILTVNDSDLSERTGEGNMRLWDVAKGRELPRYKGYTDSEASVRDDDVFPPIFAPHGHTILIVKGDHVPILQDLASGQVLRLFVGHTRRVTSAVFSPDGQTIVTMSDDQTVRVWDVATGRELHRFEGHTGPETFVGFSPNGESIVTANHDHSVRLYEVATGRELGRFVGHEYGVTFAVFSPDGQFILTTSHDDTMRLWHVTTGQELRRFKGHTERVSSAVFAPDGQSLVTVDRYSTVRLWEVATGQELRQFEGHTDQMASAVLSTDGQTILTTRDRTVYLWEVKTGQRLRRFEGHSSDVRSAVFSPNNQFVLTTSNDYTTRLWNTENGKEVARLVSFSEMGKETWVVATPDGRFDTNNLDKIKGLYWVMPDEPLRALPLEIFMRDYYEPQLLPRVLAEQLGPFKPMRPLQELNRAQPRVVRIELLPGTGHGLVDVEVKVAGAAYTNATTGTTHSSSVHDLRLFRDGQLVGQWPEPKASTPDGGSSAELAQWRADTQVVPGNGSTTVMFRGVKLPHGDRWRRVEFSAYAFNEDRVKGETVRTMTTSAGEPDKKRAYLVAVGVDDYGDDRWNLRYATKDASAMAQALAPRLAQAGYEPQVTLLGSDAAQRRTNKDSIRGAIEGLAGVSTPDDVVILFFSGHGYSGEQREAFYLLPGDSQPSKEHDWRRPTSATLARTISAEELSRWVRKIDAAEIVLIIDACHSAASIEAGGQKPGPLGGQGLGQLAYDKRMRVLAASQSDQAAREIGGQIGAGVLTYALVHDALQANQAANARGFITLKRWLQYAERRVPQLLEEVRTGKVNDYGVAVAKDAIPPRVQGAMTQNGAVQVPILFDYARGEQPSVLVQMGIRGLPGLSSVE